MNKKAYDSVPIFNILTKLYNLGIRSKCYLFLRNLYLSSKARTFFNGNLFQIRADALKLKKLLTEDFIGVIDLNLVILMLFSMI